MMTTKRETTGDQGVFRNRHLKTTAGAGIVIAAAAFAIFTGASAVWAAANPNAYGVLAVLKQPVEARDAIPFDGDHQFGDGMGLVYESSRFLGETPEASHWVVLDRDGNICLASQDADGLAMVFGCATVDSFTKRGVSVGFFATSVEQENYGQMDAYLVPDSLHYVSEVEGLAQVSSNLVAGRSADPAAFLQFASSDGRASLELATLEPSSR